MIPVTRTYLPPLEEYTTWLAKVWENGWITNNGHLCDQLRTDLIGHLQVPNLELVANGTLALQIAIKALGIYGEVITTPYSYVATVNSILWEGCTPVFVDIETKTFCIDPDAVEAAITKNTTAILATHVYGYPCDVEKLQALADKHGIKLIYDAAHAFGVRIAGKSILNYGDCSTLSLHATKLFHSAEGGAVICRNAADSKKVFLMKKFGHIGEESYEEIGINAKMSELHAAMGLCILPKIGEIISYRKKCSKWYDEYLEQCPLQRPTPRTDLQYNYAYYPIVFPSHEKMIAARSALTNKGVAPRRYFFPSLNTLPHLASIAKQQCPNSEDIASRVLCLPLYVGLEQRDIHMISETIKHCL